MSIAQETLRIDNAFVDEGFFLPAEIPDLL